MSGCPIGLFPFPPLLDRLLCPLDHSLLPCDSTSFFSLCLVWEGLSFLLFKKGEHLIRSLEHVSESRSWETSQELGKPQEMCGRMGLWPGRGLYGQCRLCGPNKHSRGQWDLPSCLFLLFFNLLHCPRLGFLGSRLTLRLVFTGYIRECSWDQHLGKGGEGEKRWRGEGRGGTGRKQDWV